MYKVIEVAEKIGVSKVTIYKKINSLKQKIKPYIYKKKGITYIDDTGLDMIRDSLDTTQAVNEIKNAVKIEKVNNQYTKENSMGVNELTEKIDGLQDDYIKSLQGQIDYLKNELDIKNKQLNTKDELIRNFQVLLREDKNRIILLEEKLEEKEISKDQQTVITEQIMKEVKEENEKLRDYIAAAREDENKKTFWRKILGR